MKLTSVSALVLLQIAQFANAQNCGAGIGSCPSGQCCSQWGYCGTTPEHCGGQTPPPPPSGGSGSGRPKVGNVPYGQIISSCTSPGKIALTYDDGPSEYTSELLNTLSSMNVKATFFITGLGSRADIRDSRWANIIRRTHSEGHQIANHGWAHKSLPSMDYNGQLAEITENERALQEILGFFPTYYRCPYLDCNPQSGLPILNDLGYHVIGVNADTKDYLYDAPELIHNAMDAFAGAVSWNPNADSYINLAHDIRYQTVATLTRFMIETARARGYQLVTVGECLGDPRENWYRGGNGGGSAPPSTFVTVPQPAPTSGKAVSPNGLCAGNEGYTCQGSNFGSCCSQYGFCGSTGEYCGGGCNRAFGTCA